MKGALAILLEVFRSFHQKYPDASLGLAISSDEEQGGESGVSYLFGDVGLRCGLVINPDGGGLNEITIAEKGVLHLHLARQGRAIHAARPWLGDNALEHLLECVMDVTEHFSRLPRSDDHWHPTCTLTKVSTPNESINRVPSEAHAVPNRDPAARWWRGN